MKADYFLSTTELL